MVQEQNLYALRKQLRLSQEKMAEKLGVSRNTISRWESGKYNPSAENLAMLNKMYREVENSDAPEKTEAPAGQELNTPVRRKRWPVIVVCIGGICALIAAIVACIGVYTTNLKLNQSEPENTKVFMENLEGEEVDTSQWESYDFLQS